MQKAVSKILLVDTDPSHAQNAFKILAVSAVEITHLTSGEQALGYLFGDAAKTALPNLVILHLGLPHHFVVEILEKMRTEKATQKIPVLILADSMDEKQLLERFAFTLCSCAVKPLTFGKLVYALPALGMAVNESILYPKSESNGTSLAYR